MAQPSGPEGQRPARRLRIGHHKLLNRISIQSKLILMLALCTVLAAAIVGGIAYQNGRNSLRTAAVDRLIEIREAQKRQMSEQLLDLRNALIAFTHGVMSSDALRDFTAGFEQLGDARITPEMSKAITESHWKSW
ncbi:MAG: adenylate/guanylate cyclase domain-containing protein, partial [Mycobacterium sp.]|nr:adenylate/guanylate cyclase domain-containing protein [Mycobacterium sp.]